MPRVRVGFSRQEDLKYLSHLDLLRVFTRALRRAGAPLSYSQGFNPQPRLIFAAPLPVGVTAGAELLDIYLEKPWDVLQVNAQLPRGINVHASFSVDEKAPSLMALVEGALYRVRLAPPPENSSCRPLMDGVAALLRKSVLTVPRRGRKKSGTVDIRPFIENLEIETVSGSRDFCILNMLLRTGSRGGARPDQVLEVLLALLPKETGPWRVESIHRLGLFTGKGKALLPLGFYNPKDPLEKEVD